MKITDNFLGKEIYVVYNNATLTTHKIVRVELNIYHSKSKAYIEPFIKDYYSPYDKRTFFDKKSYEDFSIFFTREKAEKVLKLKLEIMEREMYFCTKKEKEYKKLQESLPELEKVYPKKVLIRTSKVWNTWDVFDRDNLIVIQRSRKNVIGFKTKYHSRTCVFDRENKNWKWYTKLNQLELDKQELLDKIKKLNSELEIIENQIKEEKGKSNGVK